MERPLSEKVSEMKERAGGDSGTTRQLTTSRARGDLSNLCGTFTRAPSMAPAPTTAKTEPRLL